MSQTDDMKKIVLIGLDNSGKTSILLSLQKNTNIMSYYSLKPTQGLNIVQIEDELKRVAIWELGGQKNYQEDHLRNLNKYTQEAEQLIFVIDVQDTTRYELALQYLAKIIERLENKEIEFLVYLHKFDPGLEKVEKFSTERLSSVLINRINTIVPSEYKCKIFKTSISAIFQRSQLQ